MNPTNNVPSDTVNLICSFMIAGLIIITVLLHKYMIKPNQELKNKGKTA